MAMENNPFEDVFPIENGDFPLLCLFTLSPSMTFKYPLKGIPATPPQNYPYQQQGLFYKGWLTTKFPSTKPRSTPQLSTKVELDISLISTFTLQLVKKIVYTHPRRISHWRKFECDRLIMTWMSQWLVEDFFLVEISKGQWWLITP